ncbi:cytochrome c biogenesis protein CcdA [Nocardia vermiculata]|uniref:Cytochrome c biogenesis protein CcdA n=1 Tax=Nocardia vermiculata TaxID=257274 RepID=A0A846Y3V5_9NOCA|nr:cytochrome c biogenesis protein CcdA [Nocardia vermiculata]NKY53923.1 cytochrome c biogenesis protein CcdA [Nocardia vermiculata]
MGGLLALAFTAGMLAPVNPCGFALLPAWITHTLGDTTTAPLPIRMGRALRAGAALTLGFAGTLAAAGLAISGGAKVLISAAPRLGLAVGAVLVLLGLLMLTGRSLGLRLPTRRHPAASTTVGMVAAGAGYAAASLSCTFGVLLAVIAQAQATAGWGGLTAIFTAYTGGAATILLLVALATAAAGTALTRRLAVLARYGPRLTALVLLATGAYLIWYWLPAATGHTTSTTGSTPWSATVSNWLQTHTTLVTTMTALAVAATVLAVIAHHITRRRGTEPVAIDCCTPETTPIQERQNP